MKKIFLLIAPLVFLAACNKGIPDRSTEALKEKANVELRVNRFLASSYRKEGKLDSARYYEAKVQGMREVMGQMGIPEE